MNVAVIPARGGSKRIPRKNIRAFHGKPIIAWSIEAARNARCFDRIIVSTDDGEISEVAKNYGAEVPFVRPLDLADDYSGTTAVISHATQWMIDNSWAVNAVCCIYATAPFIDVSDLVEGEKQLLDGDWAYTFSATEYPSSIYRAFREHPDGGIEMLYPDRFSDRSQDLPLVLHDAGQFYWGRTDAWIKRKLLFDRHSRPLRIPRWRVHDIDTEEDWVRAELLFEAMIQSDSPSDSEG